MNSLATFLVYALVLVAVSMAGASVPHARDLKDHQAHLLISLSTGIFIGLLFLMLLPEALHEAEEGGYDIHLAMYAVVCGFVAIMAVEVAMTHHHLSGCDFECHEEMHGHRITSMSSFIGLSVHAACDGLALAATFLAGEEIGLMATVGMCIHKFVVLFSLSSTMLLTGLTHRQSMRYLLMFSLITPIAGILFFLMLTGIDMHGVAGLPLAFAAGTFMYVALCDLLPESFHRKRQDIKSFALIVLGILLILAVSLLFPHVH